MSVSWRGSGSGTLIIFTNSAQEQSGAIYAVECRPAEDGHFAIVQHLNGQTRDVLPTNLSAHATVQELGGGSMAIRPDGKIILAEGKSCDVYLLDPATSTATRVHAAVEGIRYGDFCIHPKAPQWVIAIKEDHRDATPETQATHVHNVLVAIDIESGTETTIAEGDDFYSHPKFDSEGKYLSWIQWSHPDMPWTGTVLYAAQWTGSLLQNTTRVAGEAQKESIAQPKWGLDGMLYFTSDRTGHWQLYSFNVHDHNVRPLFFPTLESSDFAIAEWKLGRYALTHPIPNVLSETDRSIVPHTSHLTRRLLWRQLSPPPLARSSSSILLLPQPGTSTCLMLTWRNLETEYTAFPRAVLQLWVPPTPHRRS